MMPKGSPLLLPASPVFIWLSLLVAMALNMLPWGRWPGWPDWVLLALVFWNVHQSRRVGIGSAFAFGLIMDVHQGALLGQHALAYTVASFLAVSAHRRLLWFPVRDQAVQILSLFLAAHLVSLIVRMMAGGAFPGWGLVCAPIFEALLWPVASYVLLMPQRRPPDRDRNRPL